MPTNPVRKHYSLSIKDAYKLYKKEYKDSEVSYKQYKGVLYEFIAAVMKRVIWDNWTFYLPFKLGALTVVSQDQTRENAANPINYRETIINKKKIVHLNLNTFRRVYKMQWIKSFVKFKNKKYYTFQNSSSLFAQRYGVGRRGMKDYIDATAKDNNIKLIK